MLETILLELLKQTPTIIVMGIGLYYFANDNKELRKEAKDERDSHNVSMAALVVSNSEQVEKTNQYIRERDLENLETLTDVSTLLEKVSNGQDKTQEGFNALRSEMANGLNSLHQKIIENGKR